MPKGGCVLGGDGLVGGGGGLISKVATGCLVSGSGLTSRVMAVCLVAAVSLLGGSGLASNMLRWL